MSLTIRTASPPDAPGIAMVHVRSWQHGYADLVPAEFLAALSVREREQRWRTILGADEPTSHNRVAEIDGRIVGFVTVGPCRDDDATPATGELWSIYVLPSWWGHHVGHTLHEHGIHLLAALRFTQASLWMLEGNTRAEGFYRRRGWAPDGARRIEHRANRPLAEVRYRRPLSPTPSSAPAGA